ncbi:hypothetical protein [Streptomyces avicenniae]|uniref:hypothetical protein n=1 Tax=Streptomyces avicenniae TaxID=500153 RepID=UPI0006993A73|nr:hypothetical protein [Streptomyces avicenniae]
MLIGTACTLLTAAGLGISFLVARRRRYATALRLAALSLLPVGLAMTGVVRFVVNMTFNPVAWAGFGVLAFAVLLFLSGRLADGRGRPAKATAQAPAPAADLPAGRRTGGRKAVRGGPATSGAATGGGEDFSDIEAILKKHGI